MNLTLPGSQSSAVCTKPLARWGLLRISVLFLRFFQNLPNQILCPHFYLILSPLLPQFPITGQRYAGAPEPGAFMDESRMPLCNRILTICCTCHFNPLSVLNHTLLNVTITTRPEAWISSWACNACFWNEWRNAYWLQHEKGSSTDSHNHLHSDPTCPGRTHWK